MATQLPTQSVPSSKPFNPTSTVPSIGASANAAGNLAGAREVHHGTTREQGAQGAGPAAALGSGGEADAGESVSLVSTAVSSSGEESGSLDDEGSLRLSAPMMRLPVTLTVAVPVREFQVRKLLAMAPGMVIQTQWGHGEDLPLSSGDVQLAWSEFEVVDTRLAVRVTRPA